MEPQQGCPSREQWEDILESLAPEGTIRHLDGCPHCQAVVERLTAGDRAWLDIAEELRRPAPSLPPACRRALEARGNPERRSPRMTACLHVERMMHRSSIAVSGESAAGYTLVKLIPAGLGAARPMRLNLALAL